MAKKKRKTPLVVRSDEQAKTILGLTADVRRLSDKLADDRRLNHKLTEANERMLERLGEQNDLIEEMYREYYELGKCLSATREEWAKCRDEIAKNRKTWTIGIEARVADPTDVERVMGDCDGTPFDSALNDGP